MKNDLYRTFEVNPFLSVIISYSESFGKEKMSEISNIRDFGH